MAPKTSSLQVHRRGAPVARTEAPRHGAPSSSGLGSKSTAAPYVEQQPLSPTDDKTKRRCDRCGKLFSPRRGSGGTQQRFCSSECRGSPIGSASVASVQPRTLAQQPNQNKTPPREPAVPTPHPWETGVLDIVDCERVEFMLALKECETAGTGTETWPAEVRARIEQGVNRWIEENNKTRTVCAVTLAAPKRSGVQYCVLILHHVLRGSHPDRRPTAQGEKAPEAARDA